MANDDLGAGLRAFKDALKPQEGKFMREATYIMNEPKDLSGKFGGTDTPGEKIAQALLDRNKLGQFVSKKD